MQTPVTACIVNVKEMVSEFARRGSQAEAMNAQGIRWAIFFWYLFRRQWPSKHFRIRRAASTSPVQRIEKFSQKRWNTKFQAETPEPQHRNVRILYKTLSKQKCTVGFSARTHPWWNFGPFGIYHAAVRWHGRKAAKRFLDPDIVRRYASVTVKSFTARCGSERYNAQNHTIRWQ